MQRIAFKVYLRASALNREVWHAVRYAKDTPSKKQAIIDYLQAALDEIKGEQEIKE